MKRILVFAVLLLPALGVRAQSLTPEFRLDLWITDTTTTGTVNIIGQPPLGTGDPKAFGYDALATDGYDQDFGEEFDFPGSNDKGHNVLCFNYPNSTNATEIDIRQKPALDSFALDYPAFLSFEEYPGSMFWDPKQIPDQIKGIWIRPSWSTTPLADMTHSRIFTVPDITTQTTWGYSYIITVFYKMQPRFIPAAVVNGSSESGGGLISNASVFPNPMPSGGALDLTLNDAASLSIVGYDVAGREVLRLRKNAPAGETRVALAGFANAHGAVLIRIDAASGARHDTKSVVAMRE